MEPSERDGDLCEVWGHPPLSVRWPEPIVGPNVSNHKVTCQVSIKVMDSQPGTSDKRGEGLIICHQDSYRSFLFHCFVNLSRKDFSASAMTPRNVEPCLSSLLRVPSLEDRRPSPLLRTDMVERRRARTGETGRPCTSPGWASCRGFLDHGFSLYGQVDVVPNLLGDKHGDWVLGSYGRGSRGCEAGDSNCRLERVQPRPAS